MTTPQENKDNALSKSVENAFPTEDADEKVKENKSTTNEKGTPLWGKDQNEKKDGAQIRPASQTDIMLYIAREVHLMRLELEAIMNKTFADANKKSEPLPVMPPPVKSEKLKQLEDALKEFVPSMLEINDTESNMFFVVRFKQFLGSENFAKISAICRNLGGSYVSEGKKSHFTIPKQQ